MRAIGQPVMPASGEREEIEDEAHLGEVADGEGERGVEADAGAETTAEVFIGAHAHDTAEERNDD